MFGGFTLSSASGPSFGPKQNTLFNNDDFYLGGEEDFFELDPYIILVKGHITKSRESGELIDQSQLAQTIVEYYERYGEMFYEKFDGLFFIVLYHKDTKELRLCNNRYLTTSCYYYLDQDKLLFSDSLGQVAGELQKQNPHFGSVRSFISNGFTITDQTQVENIKKMLPSFSIAASSKGVDFKNHWDNEFKFDRKPFDNVEAHLDRYEEVYRKGIKEFLTVNKTKELGSLLSGGHDTSFCVIQASKVHDKPVHCYTSTFPGWAFDEEDYARNICEKNKGIFRPIPFLPEDLDYMVSLIRTNEEPVVGSSLPLHKIALVAANEVDTMLGGDGGDTLWGEYYPVQEYHRYVKNMPLSMRKLCHKASKFLRDTTDWERFWELEHVASLFTDDDYYDGFMRKLCTYRHYTDDAQKELFTPDVFAKSSVEPSMHEVKFTKDNFANTLIEGKLFNAFYTYQSFHTYKSMNHFGLPLYFPTVNKDVMDLITSLPWEWVNGGTTFHRLTNNKSINRKFHKMALSRYLRKDEIYNRSFDIPWYNILRPRKEVLRLLRKRLVNRGWYNESFINQLFDDFESQHVKEHELLELKHHGYRIFTLLSLEIWCMEYLDGKNTENPDQKIPLEDYLAL
jgi:asparagine synthase (glutamine-hydrolysing)